MSTITYKVKWCTLQLRRQIHSPLFLIYPYMYSVGELFLATERELDQVRYSENSTRKIRQKPIKVDLLIYSHFGAPLKFTTF
jgi:hypothetical protein